MASQANRNPALLCTFVLCLAIFTNGCRGMQEAFVPTPTTSPVQVPVVPPTPVPAKVTVSLSASATTINAGDTVTLTIGSSNATSVSIDNNVGTVPANGPVSVTPAATTTYTATATGADGATATSAVTITVTQPAPTTSFSAHPTAIIAGSSSTLKWTTANAQSVTIDNGVGAVASSGSVSVTPSANTTYTLTANGLDGSTVTATVAITVAAVGSPLITLTVSPGSITSGQTATLSWTTTNVTEVRIDSGDGPLGGKSGLGVFFGPGSITVSPSHDTTYTAVATNNSGQTATATAQLKATQDTAKLKANVKHIVYMLQENRSFDMHFGKLNDYRASLGLPQDVDGLPTNASNNAPDGTQINAFHIRTSCVENITPDWLETHGDYNLGSPGSQVPSLDGFVSNGAGMAKFSGGVTESSGSSGTFTVTPSTTTTYYLFRNNAGIVSATLTVVVDGKPGNPPSIPNEPGVAFTASSTNVSHGTPIVLTWDAPGATSVLINTWFDQIGRRTMGYYNATDLPFTYFMAANFATSDRWFAPMPGNSPGNRAYAYAATTHGKAHDPGTLSVKNIFQSLQEAGKTWKVYYSSTDPATGKPQSALLRFPTFAAANMDKLVPVSQYYADVAANSLPDVAFIEEASGLDEHPGATLPGDIHSGNNVQAGAAYVAKLINALLQSPAWPDTVFFLTYDEFGGQYDHVVPPDAVHPDGIAPTDLEPKDVQYINPPADFTRTSFRVPLIVISPWTKKNYVSHTTADFTAILRLIEARHDLPSLTARDAAQIDLLEFFDFDGKPWATPPSPPAQPTTLPCNYTNLN